MSRRGSSGGLAGVSLAVLILGVLGVLFAVLYLGDLQLPGMDRVGGEKMQFLANLLLVLAFLVPTAVAVGATHRRGRR